MLANVGRELCCLLLLGRRGSASPYPVINLIRDYYIFPPIKSRYYIFTHSLKSITYFPFSCNRTVDVLDNIYIQHLMKAVLPVLATHCNHRAVVGCDDPTCSSHSSQPSPESGGRPEAMAGPLSLSDTILFLSLILCSPTLSRVVRGPAYL
ncbi:hypothetical protein HanXRQr2_Chr13g0578641 [Helianthus annuus]|uniref:Uncharacterized protein n=1 Tax=Helianthus annuus TaxID=4232 RepID=A0A9K3H9E1_HELAN|nr:hypothetical protein HanXRQr2_Chr13g0578641 [Helianthus annuus]KAJ0480283.1 hypothetical protein HanIR_Chr13g0629821 [Helianthus annuus]KAJ0848398.1 hypothetical protein HanPSC8_Chr13g0556811 [Helianthus annuus]